MTTVFIQYITVGCCDEGINPDDSNTRFPRLRAGLGCEVSISLSDIKNEDKYKEFDFKDIWEMGPNHPILRNCPFKDVSYVK